MTSDHLPPALARAAEAEAGEAYGFGLTLAVRTAPGTPVNPGEYRWDGAAGTAFWVGPREKLVAILMIQAPARGLYERSALRRLVYQALPP